MWSAGEAVARVRVAHISEKRRTRSEALVNRLSIRQILVKIGRPMVAPARRSSHPVGFRLGLGVDEPERKRSDPWRREIVTRERLEMLMMVAMQRGEGGAGRDGGRGDGQRREAVDRGLPRERRGICYRARGGKLAQILRRSAAPDTGRRYVKDLALLLVLVERMRLIWRTGPRVGGGHIAGLGRALQAHGRAQTRRLAAHRRRSQVQLFDERISRAIGPRRPHSRGRTSLVRFDLGSTLRVVYRLLLPIQRLLHRLGPAHDSRNSVADLQELLERHERDCLPLAVHEQIVRVVGNDLDEQQVGCASCRTPISTITRCRECTHQH